MKNKIFKSIFFTSILITFLSVILITYVLYHYYTRQELNNLENISDFVSVGYLSEGKDYLDRLKTNYRITIIDPSGQVSFDSAANPEKLDNHAERAEVLEAQESGTGKSIRYSDTLNQIRFYYAEKLENGDILRISAEEASYFQILGGLIQLFVWILMLSLVASVALSYFLTKNILKPLEKIDLNHLESSDSYAELAFLIDKIRRQQKDLRTQIKNNEKLLADFRIILKKMKEGLIILDKNKKILSINESAYDLLNLYEDMGIEEALANYFNEDDQLVNQNLEIGSRIISLRSNPVYQNGDYNGEIILLLDITEQQKRQNLRAEYFSNLSHELKTPITSISGYSEIIYNGIAKPEDIPEFINKIYLESQHLNKLIKRILMISRLDEKDLKLEIQEINLSELILSVLNRFHHQIEKKKLSLETKIEPDILIQGNDELLNEMVFNLIDNAIKYNKDSGTIQVSLEEQQEQIIFKVEDTGIGINAEEKERIFERFYRTDKSRSKDISGTGLGLAIVKKSVLFHQAKVNLDSVVDKGTRFTITFNKNNQHISNIQA